MKLIYLYGPPAVGKLTIANKISELTGIKVFNNNLTSDLVWNLFGRYEGEWQLINKLREEIVEEASRLNTSLIFTGTYTKEGDGDDKDIKEIIQLVEKHNGKVEFVQILADRTELIRRVNNISRFDFQKLTDPQILIKLLDNEDFISRIPFVDSLQITNTNLSIDESANIIITKLSL